jgi:hypothetical protein
MLASHSRGVPRAILRRQLELLIAAGLVGRLILLPFRVQLG